MKQFLSLLLLTVSALHSGVAAENRTIPVARESNVSLRNEAQVAIDRGLAWLKTQQGTNGGWSNPDQPALTALVLAAFLNEPSQSYRAPLPAFLTNGFGCLLASVQADGGIYRKNLQNYNTSLTMMALLAAREPKYDPIIRRARQFIAGQQNDFNEPGKMDSPWDGGIGYGGSTPHADLSNTMIALEALYFSRRGESDPLKGLNLAAAIEFIQRCQNLPGKNPEPWVSDDTQNRGGFIYYPGKSMAGETNLPNGRVALRSYGTMTYAGLLSYIYADVKRDDPHVTAAYDWLRRNYTLAENPGMGQEGLYYYFQLMAKTLTIRGVDAFPLADGTMVNWREQLAKRLFDLQARDGSWVNSSGRWMEKDPVLVTAYAIQTLSHLARGM